MPIHYTTFMGLRWRLRVVYSRASPLLSVLAENFLSPLFGQNFDILVPKKGVNVNFNNFNPQRFEPCMIPRVLVYCASRPVQGSDLWVGRRKKGICIYIKKNDSSKKRTSPQKTPVNRSPPNLACRVRWPTWSSVPIILAIGLGVLDLWGVEFCHFPISRRSPLTQCWRYRAACDVALIFLIAIACRTAY